MDIITTVAGPSMRGEHALGACPGTHGLTRVNSYADVWSEQGLRPAAVKPFPHQRPRPASILDPQRASAPPRWGP